MCEPLQMLPEPEDGRAVRGLVAADALEDTRAVVEPVHADVDLRVGPVDELAVHPDRLCLAHQVSPLELGIVVESSTASIGCARASRTRTLGCMAAMWVSEPAPTQTMSCASRLWSISTRSTFGSGKGATAPGREARRLLDLRPARDPRLDGAGSQRDLREVGAPVTGHERDHRTAVAEDDDRLDDLVDRTAGGAGGVLGGRGARLELFEPRLRSCRPQIRGDPFDGLGPALAHDGSVPAAANPNSGVPRCLFRQRRGRREAV